MEKLHYDLTAHICRNCKHCVYIPGGNGECCCGLSSGPYAYWHLSLYDHCDKFEQEKIETIEKKLSNNI